MLAKSNMRSLTYPVSQLLDVSKNVRAEVDNEETKTCRKKRYTVWSCGMEYIGKFMHIENKHFR